ncbi:uncharacterized protein [Dysidea avara]|uniref:uncharacterized protein n=1 Tax=Dysidea avara TaxID=196820 RepID=UPI00332123EB
MCAILNKVEEVDKAELEKVFAEGDNHGVGTQIREVWTIDKRQQLAQFKVDQDRNVTGKQSNQWSMITIRIALAIFTRSPAAYEALKSFKILQLPSRSTLQSYTGTFLHEPGVSNQCIADQVARYVMFKAECEKQGKRKPQSDGVMIFDEVKVACQLIWNSRSHKLSGLAMTNKDMSSLNDIYRVLKEPDSPGQTSYILQFLWRDLTSSYDIVGPYFTSKESVDAQFILSCVLETVHLFQTCGLRTSLIVCDGSPANLTTIKLSHGHSGAYSVISDTASNDVYEVKPWMVNPFNPPWLIYWMICPTHQLKNMINVLFSSKSGGTKLFKRGQHHGVFGWNSIIAMYQREVSRAKQNLTRMVPRLKEVHVVRDSWTKLNVSPAKIMQQEQVLGELFWYTNQDPLPADSDTTNETWEYLQACHKLFESGFLSHDKVDNMDSPVLQNIDDGYKYFTSWLSTLLEEDSDYPHVSSNQKSFLSWQTWDLLCIDVYSFRAFCKDFFAKHPGYFVSPLRISGSAVESLFSQFKRNAGGKLDSCNYVTARCAHLVQQCASGHHSGVGYRDETLTYMELPLHKKSYGNS